MKHTKGWISILSAGLLLAGLAACAPQAATEQPVGVPTQGAPTGEIPAVADQARGWLASQLGKPVENIRIDGAKATDWPDSCLGLGGPAESCLAEIVPGWQVALTVDGQAFEVRADEAGTQFRSPQVNATADALSGTRWQLAAFRADGKDTPPVAGSQVTLEFLAGGNTGGNAGCNHYGGWYALNGDQITFKDLAQTEMACEGEGVMEQETRYLQALGKAAAFEIVADQLVITSAEGQPALEFSPVAEVNADLVGTTWQLSGFQDGDVASSTVAGSQVSLEFLPDGTLSGNAGCNSFGGQYTLDGDQLSVKEVNSTLMACDNQDVMAQETRFLDALKQASAYQIAGDQLTITTGEGQPGLTFTQQTAAASPTPPQ
jgi:heat shock protein HslJ